MTDFSKLPDRAVIRLTGEDCADFLQGLITQDIQAVAQGKAIFAALLAPQGKILFDFFLTEKGGAYFLDCHSDSAEALVKRLTLYKLRAKVLIELEGDLRVFAASEGVLENALIQYPDPRHSQLGFRAIKSSDGEKGDTGSYEARRIGRGVPEFGKDFGGDEMFLLDVNYDALNAVSYKKGCFVGQEVTSRMKRKGEVRKRTLIAEFDDAPSLKQVTKGASVVAGDVTLGTILSSEGNKALALIRLDRWGKVKAAGVSSECVGNGLRLMLPDYLDSA